jgi:hypothetical protein
MGAQISLQDPDSNFFGHIPKSGIAKDMVALFLTF